MGIVLQKRGRQDKGLGFFLSCHLNINSVASRLRFDSRAIRGPVRLCRETGMMMGGRRKITSHEMHFIISSVNKEELCNQGLKVGEKSNLRPQLR